MLKNIVPLAALLLAGCASSSGVVSTGPGAYSITSTAITSFGGAGTATKDAYAQARKYCADQGRQMVLSDQHADAQFTGATVDVRFRCEPR